MKQIVHMAKLFAYLISNNSVPLHFLKVVDFDDMDQPTTLMMYLVIEAILE